MKYLKDLQKQLDVLSEEAKRTPFFTEQPQPLKPELVKYLIKKNLFHHKFCVDPFFTEAFSHRIDLIIRIKEVQSEIYLQEKRYESYIFIHERPYRPEALSEVIDCIPAKSLGNIIREVWTDQEYLYSQKYLWEDIFNSISNPTSMMLKEEKDFFKTLPKKIKIYRGQKELSHVGLSWTLSLDKAKWFANRWQKEGLILEAKVDKKGVLGYLNCRQEEEILIKPEYLNILEFSKLGGII